MKGAFSMRRTVAGASALLLVLSAATTAVARSEPQAKTFDPDTGKARLQELLADSEEQNPHVPEDRGKAARADGLTRALQRGDLNKSEHALARAEALFDLKEVRNEYGDVAKPDSQEATLALRDLALAEDDLSRLDQREADSILARPSDGASDPEDQGWEPGATVAEPSCYLAPGSVTIDDPTICVHYVTTTDDAPPATDVTDVASSGSPNGVPDAVDDTVNAIWYAWNAQVGDGNYPSPKNDHIGVPAFGLTQTFDVYLSDIGDDGLYGYCTSDDPDREVMKQVSAYCVLDNDYEKIQYEPDVFEGPARWLTAAHEFFHAVQFNMDWKERAVIMEGTATWIEDAWLSEDDPYFYYEYLDSINANYQFLQDSALHSPEVSLDAYQNLGDGENFEYGAWLFYRFLEERYDSWGPEIVRMIWEEAAGSKNGVAAIRSALAKKNIQFRKAFAEFARWNRTPSSDNTGVGKYEEGDQYLVDIDYRYPPWDATHYAAPAGYDYGKPTTGKKTLKINHLASRYALWFPMFGASEYPKAKLQVNVNLPNRSRGPEAYLMVTSTKNFKNDRCTKEYPIKLDSSGAGKAGVPFGEINCGGQVRDVFWATLVLTNTGSNNNEPYVYSGKVSAS